MRIVSIKFREAGKRYDFDAQQHELTRGTRVVVETDRGRALGIVVADPRDTSDEAAPKGLKSVLRVATDDDLKLALTNAAREQDAQVYCSRRIEERRMEMKLVRAEYLFDGSKIVFYFTADGRVDFRELVKDLAHHFHTRIEMRQIGVRDEAKLVGGIGVCGRELCCCTFLTEFNPVSVKMAKEQGLALNPTKISGQCGRLLCCLGYEFETYCSLRKGLPKAGKKIEFAGRQAQVVDLNILGQKLTLQFEDGERATLTVSQFASGSLGEEADAKTSEKPERSGEARPRRRESRPSRSPRGEQRREQPRKDKPRKEQQPAAKPPVAEQAPDQAAAPGTGADKPKRRRRRGRRRPKSDKSE